jgi:hypothetical protein
MDQKKCKFCGKENAETLMDFNELNINQYCDC